jgi:hypothetical protein
MSALSKAIKANAAVNFSYKPVALFVGGTSGIGKVWIQVYTLPLSSLL